MNTAAHQVTVLGFQPATGSVSFLNLFKPYTWRMFMGFALLVATNLAALTIPRLINVGVQLVDGQVTDSQSNMTMVVGSLLALAVFGALTRTFSRQTLFSVGRDLERDLRRRLFYHLSLLSSGFYARRSVGDLMNHLTSDINNIRMFAGFVALNFLNLVIVFSVNVPLLVSIDEGLALAALSPFVLVIVAAQTLTGRMFRRVKEYQAALSAMTAHVQENLSGAQIVRVFHQETAEEKKFAKTNDHTFQSALRLAKIRVVLFPLMRLMGGLGIAVTLFVGGRQVALGHITLGDYVEVNARLLQLAWPAISIGFILSVYSQSRASLVRLNELLSERPDIIDGPHASSRLNQITIQNLSLALDEKKQVLTHINFSTGSGQVLGIVGPSGSGKSTLLRAIARETPVERGKIFYNGVDALDWDLSFLHRQIAVVSSEPFLFSASLRDNITFARAEASDDEIKQVIDQVGLSGDIEVLADGLETLIGERGVMLSGGQRQRVALARAILAQAPVMLLDDCLSAVDVETEHKIISTLRRGKIAECLIIVSHRLSAIRHADEIIVLDKGKIIERGRHGELIKHGKLYSALWGVEKLQESLSHE